MKTIYRILSVIFLSLVFMEDVTAQTDSGLKSVAFYFDTTKVDSPLYISGFLSDIENIKGIHIQLSQAPGSTPIINDTLYIVGSHGSYYSVWKDAVSPTQGSTITQSIFLTAVQGMYYCSVCILYKNGTTSAVSALYLKK